MPNTLGGLYNWSPLGVLDSNKQRKNIMEENIREIIVDALFNNNFKVNYAGDLSRFLKELDNNLEINIKGE